MSPEEREKLFALKKRSKTGQYLSPEDMMFFDAMYKNYPKEYNQDNYRLYAETIPFGAEPMTQEEWDSHSKPTEKGD